MNRVYQLSVEEHNTDTNNSISNLIDRIAKTYDTVTILKGAKIYNGKSSIVYIIGSNENSNKLDMIYRNNKKVVVAKRNKTKNSYFEFSTWDILRINNGQITGSNMNMLNDNDKYRCFKVVGD